jgi:hypothetical protein
MKRWKGIWTVLILAFLVAPAALAAAKKVRPESVAPAGIRVAVYNDEIYGPGSYFYGGDSNAYDLVKSILDSDPQGRFATTVVTDLSAQTLANFDVLSLPDNSVPDQFLADVSAWFVPGKVIVCFDSAVSYAAYSGLFWPGYSGDVFYGTLWDYEACSDDGQISQVNYITSDYFVGQSVSTESGDAEYYPEMLPANANVFLVSAGCYGGGEDVTAAQGKGGVSNPRFRQSRRDENGSSLVYGAYRDVTGHGRMVLLGPYDEPGDWVYDAWPMIRNAHTIGFNANFYDDYNRSEFCASTTTGAYKWTILSGPWAGMTFTGTGKVFNAGAKFTSAAGDPNSFSLVYDPVRHKASGWLITGGRYFPLADKNTLDDPAGCQEYAQPAAR